MTKRVGFLALAGLVVSLCTAPAFAADVTGRAAIGGSGGMMLFTSGEDFSQGTMRPIGQIVVKYNFSEKWAAVVETGYGWNSYANDFEDPQGFEQDRDSIAVVVPTTAGIEYRLHYRDSGWWPHFGAGLGIYSLGVKDSYRTWAETETGERYTWTKPGLYLKAGADRIFDNYASVFLDVLYHQVFAKDEDRFPDRWGNQNTSFFQFRIGGMYYFSLGGSDAVPEGD